MEIDFIYFGFERGRNSRRKMLCSLLGSKNHFVQGIAFASGGLFWREQRRNRYLAGSMVHNAQILIKRHGLKSPLSQETVLKPMTPSA